MARDTVGAVTAAVAILTLPIGLLMALFVGVAPAVAVFIVGWLLLVPLIPIVGTELLAIGEDEPTDTEADPVEALKQ